MKKEKSCGCIVFNEEQKVLLVKMNLGHWSFPKGHIEDGETEYETALRETKEETNIDCEIIEGFRYESSYSPHKGVFKDVFFFTAMAKKGNLQRQLEEIAQTDFYEVDEAKKLLTYDTDKEILRQASRFMKKKGLFG